MGTIDIGELAARIQANTDKLRKYLVDNDLPLPTFDVSGPQDSLIPQHETELQAARDAIVDDALELRRLVLGPRDYLMSYHVSLCPKHNTTKSPIN